MRVRGIRDLQLAVRRGTSWRIRRDQGFALTLEEQQIIATGDAAEEEIQRREKVEGVLYARLT